MAESGSKGIGKVLQRTVTRTKEKVLQNLGKADKTKDDEFEQHVSNFQEQQATGMKLQKELKHYCSCLKEMSQASSNIYRTMKEIYESNWIGYTEFCAAHEELAGTWESYLGALNDEVVAPLNSYSSLFPEYKNKINKRNRKLTDFDGARHNHDSVSNAKKLDDNKVAKALEELAEAKQIYESINASLIEELPSFYNSRLHTLSSAFSNFILAEMFFHSGAIKVKNSLADATRKLRDDSERFMMTAPDATPPISLISPRGKLMEDDRRYVDMEFKPSNDIFISNQSSNNEGNEVAHQLPAGRSSATEDDLADSDPPKNLQTKLVASPSLPAPTYQIFVANKNNEGDHQKSITDPNKNAQLPLQLNIKMEDHNHLAEKEKLVVAEVTASSGDDNDDEEEDGRITPVALKPAGVTTKPIDVSLRISREEEEEEEDEVPVPKHPTVVPSNRVLFRVKATHSYVGEDTDELSFEIGEIITVVPFDDPDEQDDGWLMGVKENTRERGVFPENFTTKVD